MLVFAGSKRYLCRSAQTGTVLIIALLVVAVITGLAIDFSGRFQLSVSRAENRLFTNQIQQSLFSLESAAIWALEQDKKDDQDNNRASYDHLDESWANATQYAVLIQAEFSEAEIKELVIEDAQGRVNLNQLAARTEKYKPSEPFEKRYTAQEKRFIRLLQTVPNNVVGSTEAEEVIQAVIDWIDRDSDVTGPGGAENDFYLSKEQAYRAANQPFVTVSELRLVKGITDEIYEHIAPLLSALPDNVGININTASATVLRALNINTDAIPITAENATTLESSRPTAPSTTKQNSDQVAQGSGNTIAGQKKQAFDNVSAFLDSNEVAQVFGTNPKDQPDPAGLTTGSSYFLLKTNVAIGDVSRRLYSLLKRDISSQTNKARVRVIRRGSEDIF